jgi:uncharacterized peroxidase-related enzyme
MLAEYKMNMASMSTDANGKSGELLQKAQSAMGFVPNMYANMANAPALLETYMHGYKAFRNETSLSASEQEVVLLTISQENGCEYCVAAHSMLAATTAGVEEHVVHALRNGKIPEDAKLAALSHFTRVLVSKRGLASKQDVDRFLSEGYSESQILEIVLAISVKTLSNYSNHLFHTTLDKAFTEWKWKDDNA